MRDVFDNCSQGIRDRQRRLRLSGFAKDVEAAALEYSDAGLAGAIHGGSLYVYQSRGSAEEGDVVWLYERRLVSHQSARADYLLLRDRNGGKCGLCHISAAASLDHHLPKSSYPIFAVTPDNLLPACDVCNRSKLASLIPTLNPCFDILGSSRWLVASVIPHSPVSVDFRLEPASTWSTDLVSRATAHFELLRLGERFAHEAAAPIAGIRHRLRGLHATLGVDGVRHHLELEAASWSAKDQNCWQAALYTALASSNWYCAGGFEV